MLAHPNHASKEPVYLHYDKTVIGNTLVEAGEADASVIAPLRDMQSYVQDGTHPGWELSEEDRWRGVAVAADGNGRYGRIDPYVQGANAALESMRNVVAVGATPRALTDCLNYGNPEFPEQLSALAEGVLGIADAGKSIRFDGEPVPVISGNVSLYNGKPDRPIDPTAVVCTVGVLPDAGKAVTMQLKKSDSVILLLGARNDECGGSAYYQILEELTNAPRDTLLGRNVPEPDFLGQTAMMQTVLHAIKSGTVLSCHDISEGGLLLCAFEMTVPQRKIGGSIGIEFDLESLGSTLRTDILLFSESPGFLLEMDTSDAQQLVTEAISNGVQAAIIGKTTVTPHIRISRGKEKLLEEELSTLLQIWKSGLNSALKAAVL